MRINTKKEAELYHFIRSKGGLKKTFLYLYQHYKMTTSIEDIVERLSKKIDYIPRQQEVASANPDSDGKMMVANFLK